MQALPDSPFGLMSAEHRTSACESHRDVDEGRDRNTSAAETSPRVFDRNSDERFVPRLSPPSSPPRPRSRPLRAQVSPTPSPRAAAATAADAARRGRRRRGGAYHVEPRAVRRRGRETSREAGDRPAPRDFEVTLGGERQEVTNFSYVSNVVEDARDRGGAPAVDKNAPPVPPARLRPSQVRRTIALVVDDLGASFESTAFIRDALKKYVDRQMQPGDLVAIIRTSAGMGALQQFTSDKRQLHAAIERVRWYPCRSARHLQRLEAIPCPTSAADGAARGDERRRERRARRRGRVPRGFFAVAPLAL